MDTGPRLRVAAVVPALNEAGSIGAVVAGLRDLGVDPVVVADNGSSDGTARLAGVAGATVVSEPRRGYGRACLAGLDHLRRRAVPPEIVVFADGDGADSLSSLPDLLAPLDDGAVGLVIGRRVGSKGVGGEHHHARLGTRWVLRAARRIHGLRAGDLGPFRAVRWELLRAMEMDDPTWGWTLQMQLRAHRLGARTVEVEVPRMPRVAGRSKVSGSPWISVRAGFRMGWTLVREWWRGRGLARRTVRRETPGGS